jgi:hypothetical protein
LFGNVQLSNGDVMKSVNTLGMILGVGMIAALGSAPEAYAGVYSNHHGSICHNSFAGADTSLNHMANGTQNPTTGIAYATCPLVRATTNTYGALAYLDIYNAISGTTQCTFLSYDYNGTLLGSTSASWTGTGYYRFGLSLGSGKSTATSNYSVVCTIPSNGNILDIDLYEY